MRSKSISEGRRKIQWSLDDTIELLARLDFTVESLRQNRGPFCKIDVVRKLQPGLGKRRNFRQIEGKLHKVWIDNVGSNPRKGLDELYRSGSSCLKSLESDMKVKIQEVLTIIKSNELYLQVSTPRKLRSTPIESIRGRHSRKPQISPSPSKSAAQRRLSCENSIEQDTITVQSLEFPSLLAIIPSETSIPDTENELKRSQSSEICIEEIDLIRTSDSNPYKRNNSPSFLYASNIQNAPAIDYENPSIILSPPDIVILDRGHETLRDLFSDNIYFRDKWSSSEKECDRLLQQHRLSYSLPEHRSADYEERMRNTVKQQQDRIITLQHQLKNQLFLQPFLELGRVRHVPPNLTKIKFNHAQMTRGLRSLSILDGFQHPVDKAAYLESQDLKELRCRVFSDMPESCPDDSAYHQVGHQVPMGLIVQSLAGAAVCEWALDGKLQCTAMIKTPLLEAYRRHLSTICDDVALRNLDFAAHQSVIDDEHFQEIFLPRVTERLAERLLLALSPFRKDNEPRETEERLRRLLESIFRSALNIKTQGMIGNNIFQYVWPERNSALKDHFMVEESSQGQEKKLRLSKEGLKKTNLVLVPGLVVYSYSKSLVDYCSFTKGDEEELGKASLVAQAVVTTH